MTIFINLSAIEPSSHFILAHSAKCIRHLVSCETGGVIISFVWDERETARVRVGGQSFLSCDAGYSVDWLWKHLCTNTNHLPRVRHGLFQDHEQRLRLAARPLGPLSQRAMSGLDGLCWQRLPTPSFRIGRHAPARSGTPDEPFIG